MAKTDHRVNLTDRRLKALRPAQTGQRYQVMDAEVGGFGVRVTDTGAVSFILRIRYPGEKNAARRSLGEYPSTMLAEAREKARAWKALVKRGVDPADEEERQRCAEAEQRRNTFAAVAADFISEKLPGERKGKEIERDIRRELLPAWGDRPISEITDLDVLTLVKGKLRQGSPAAARNLLTLIKRMFVWAKDQRTYGLARSPVADIRPTRIVGERIPRERILTDQELFALWRAAGRIGYPCGSVYRVLMLTALRLNEVADAEWSEFNVKERIWTIPADRMKSRNSRARAHVVPLTNELLAILDHVPRLAGGRYVFSTNGGESPVWMSSKVKARVDRRMLLTLRALARHRTVTLSRWANHDIRRTARTHFSRLRIPEETREAILAHMRPGIKGVYDRHDYLDEKREGLELWASRLSAIVQPSHTPSRPGPMAVELWEKLEAPNAF